MELDDNYFASITSPKAIIADLKGIFKNKIKNREYWRFIMAQYDKTILVTGGAGFIGSHLVKWFVKKYPSYYIINLDALTYAGNLENLKEIQDAPNYVFEKGDINNEQYVDEVFEKYQFTHLVHLAAESHVDRSIIDPLAFVKTNVLGTAVLLNACRKFWKKNTAGKLFYHVSTDEVYGSLGEEGLLVKKQLTIRVHHILLPKRLPIIL